jgi:FKBP-type peptidyl-prolyl cis-trans isomerase FkpA
MKRLTILAAALVTASCNYDITGLGPPSDPATETFAASLNVDLNTMTKLPGGTYIKDLVVGSGPDSVKAETDTVWVTYSGRLTDGKLIDSGTNVKFQPHTLIAGFRAALINMRVGGRRQAVIPSDQAYGAQSVPGSDGKIKIPRQSTLVFDIQLLKLHNPPPENPTP